MQADPSVPEPLPSAISGPGTTDTTPPASATPPDTGGRFRPALLVLLLGVGAASLAAPGVLEMRAVRAKPAAARPRPAPTPVAPGVARVDVEEANNLLEARAAVVLDVREDHEFEEGHIDGAVSIPLAEVGSRHGELPKGLPILTYCACSDEETSAKAAIELEKHGFEVKAIRGGVAAWRAQGFAWTTASK